MRVAEERLWQELQRVYSQDTDGTLVLDFTLRWADKVEELLSAEYSSDERRPNFRQALDAGFLSSLELFPANEERPAINASSEIVGEALFLLTQVWESSEQLVSSLTPLEHNLLNTVFSVKIRQLNEMASETQ